MRRLSCVIASKNQTPCSSWKCRTSPGFVFRVSQLKYIIHSEATGYPNTFHNYNDECYYDPGSQYPRCSGVFDLTAEHSPHQSL